MHNFGGKFSSVQNPKIPRRIQNNPKERRKKTENQAQFGRNQKIKRKRRKRIQLKPETPVEKKRQNFHGKSTHPNKRSIKTNIDSNARVSIARTTQHRFTHTHTEIFIYGESDFIEKADTHFDSLVSVSYSSYLSDAIIFEHVFTQYT